MIKPIILGGFHELNGKSNIYENEVKSLLPTKPICSQS